MNTFSSQFIIQFYWGTSSKHCVSETDVQINFNIDKLWIFDYWSWDGWLCCTTGHLNYKTQYSELIYWVYTFTKAKCNKNKLLFTEGEVNVVAWLRRIIVLIVLYNENCSGDKESSCIFFHFIYCFFRNIEKSYVSHFEN